MWRTYQETSDVSWLPAHLAPSLSHIKRISTQTDLHRLRRTHSNASSIFINLTTAATKAGRGSPSASARPRVCVLWLLSRTQTLRWSSSDKNVCSRRTTAYLLPREEQLKEGGGSDGSIWPSSVCECVHDVEKKTKSERQRCLCVLLKCFCVDVGELTVTGGAEAAETEWGHWQTSSCFNNHKNLPGGRLFRC